MCAHVVADHGLNQTSNGVLPYVVHVWYHIMRLNQNSYGAAAAAVAVVGVCLFVFVVVLLLRVFQRVGSRGVLRHCCSCGKVASRVLIYTTSSSR